VPDDELDEATRKQLGRLRIRGAPAIRPDLSPFIGEYRCEEVQLPAVRTLQLAWPEGTTPTYAQLKEAWARLAAVASAQRLKRAGPPAWVLLADPYRVEPPKRESVAILPFRGAAKEDGDVKIGRLEGGFHIQTMTAGGLHDLENVYTFLFGKFLPSKSHVLARPTVIHRIVGARTDPVEEALDRDLYVEILAPAGFEMIKPNPSVTESGKG